MAYLTFYGQHWWGYRMANSRICETPRRKITRKRDFETSLSKSGKNFLRHARSNKVQRRHPFARPKVRPKEPSVQVTRLRRTPGSFFRYQIIFSGGYTDLFHVWSRPVCHQKFFTVVLFLCGWFAMSYAPFARLCRGFVSRRVVNSTLARNMASERRHKILVTRRVPQAALEILKDSKR